MEDDSLLDAEQIEETGFIDEDGQLKRPWCPATRILEHREAEAAAREAEHKTRVAQASGAGLLGEGPAEPPPRLRLPEIVEGEPIYQKNEGGWANVGAAGVDAAAGGRQIAMQKLPCTPSGAHPGPSALATLWRLPPACRQVGVHTG